MNLSGDQLIRIEELAEQNFCPSDIALQLRVDTRKFLHVWNDKTSQIREAYDRGKLQAEITKETQLFKQVEKGNLTAIQIHDNKAAAQKFEDIKNSVFTHG